MACPFFMPTEKLESGSWLHAGRLPLGCGWSGQCMAPGHAGETPSAEELREFCNLGYAEGLRAAAAGAGVGFGAVRGQNRERHDGRARRILDSLCMRARRIVRRGMECWSLTRPPDDGKICIATAACSA